MTLRSKIPVLLSELISRGVSIKFDIETSTPIILWKYKGVDHGEIFRLNDIIPGHHGSNSIFIEQYLQKILDEVNEISVEFGK